MFGPSLYQSRVREGRCEEGKLKLRANILRADWPWAELELALVIVARVKRGRRKMVAGFMLTSEDGKN
jgi:hypothetical protein